MNFDPKTSTDKSLETDQKQTPFFARFLENQNDAKVETNVKAGKWPPYEMTMKWPSDSDEDAYSF